MKIEKRDVEAFFKKNCTFENGRVYLDDMEMHLYVQNDALCFVCDPLLSLLKFYLVGKKHFRIDGNVVKFAHPLCKFDRVFITEDGIEITFK